MAESVCAAHCARPAARRTARSMTLEASAASGYSTQMPSPSTTQVMPVASEEMAKSPGSAASAPCTSSTATVAASAASSSAGSSATVWKRSEPKSPARPSPAPRAIAPAAPTTMSRTASAASAGRIQRGARPWSVAVMLLLPRAAARDDKTDDEDDARRDGNEEDGCERGARALDHIGGRRCRYRTVLPRASEG